MAEESLVVVLETCNQRLIIGPVLTDVVQADGGADVAEVGGEFEEGGLVAGAGWVEVAGGNGGFEFVAAAEFGDAVEAHSDVYAMGWLFSGGEVGVSTNASILRFVGSSVMKKGKEGRCMIREYIVEHVDT